MLKFVPAALLCVLLCACSTAPRETPSVTLPLAPPPGEPKGVAGLEASALRASFGPPAMVRKDGTSEMWRYDNPNCKAFFFLYGAALTVRHVETVPRGREMAADEDCLAQLRVRATTPVS
jgi:hypothetical protein